MYLRAALPLPKTCIFLPVYLALAGCATYSEQPLPKKSLPAKLTTLIEQANHYPNFTQSPISLQKGLSIDDIASLALLNSPILRVSYEQYRVVNADVYNSTLLPDPQISISTDSPLGNSFNAVNAWSAGIGYDLNSLITYKSVADVGERQNRQAKLELIWTAWQVSLQAKILSVDLYYTQKKLALTAEMITAYERRYEHSKAGMIKGDVTLETNATDLSVLLDAYSQSSLLQRELNQYLHQLQQLLGVDNTTRFPFRDFNDPVELSAEEVASYMLDIDKVRPDLLALQAGYDAQEAKVRAAILAQFPAFNLGISTSKDTGGLRTNGLNIGITLPLFNGNKGNILVAQASRKQLEKEYLNRLQQAYTDVSELVQLNEIITVQQTRFTEHLSTMQNLLASARKAYAQGDLAPLPFLTAESTWFNKSLELLDLMRSKWRTQLSLSLLLMRPNKVASEQIVKTGVIYQH
ncbi:MAG: transcriptional regulator [Alteromonadaceae bacterium]|jgi:outer membrane protein TolC|uniref:Outer membrane efflux protein n=1 Tax=Paraglaciecola agarilytica NO2 TaxID=1125747 RepID=A0ABQ0I513_9ALTE|nr:TolC family protein [Paraglaciecola agarilytica]MBN28184.1 transcriptional regulator [Alteromonadaceae bacterium]GAC04433.1 hypothetical protein GAGA_1577 [Paraglaciecola agarilytica NO2]|tara:strand:- start:3641 stop:5035 length:1395 start_codon:yes stop_codon:yes gene_type:complete